MFELIRKTKNVEKDGKTLHYTNYYLQLPNGSYIPIKPAFDNDYKVLYVLAREVESEVKN